MSSPMTSATPESAAAPSAPPVADGATAGVGTAQPEVARRSSWRTVGLVALGLLIVFYGTLVISLRPAAVAGVAVLTAWSLVVNGVLRIVGSVADRDRELWWLGLLAGASNWCSGCGQSPHRGGSCC